MTNREEIVSEIVAAMRNFAELGNGTKAQRKVHGGRLRNVRKFLVNETASGSLFAPLDFISTITEKWSTYQLQLTDEAKEALKGFAVVRSSPDQSRFQILHDKFLTYCDAHNLAPSSHPLEHQYWIVEKEN